MNVLAAVAGLGLCGAHSAGERQLGRLSNRAIAARLGLTEATVKTHVTHIFEKLGVEDRAQAALAAVKRGIVRAT